MGTAVPDGSTVRLALDGGAGAAPGDAVALLLAGDTFSIHRLVRRGRSARARGYVVTHGDGNIFCDAPQPAAALIGTVRAVRTSPDQLWQPVPVPPRYGVARNLVTASFERVMSLALEISPALAIGIKNVLVLVMTPLIWLRPYEAGRTRSTSRLTSAGFMPE